MAGIYTVQQGDTLSAIARRAGMDVLSLIAQNPQFTDPNLIRPGERVYISGQRATQDEREAAGNKMLGNWTGYYKDDWTGPRPMPGIPGGSQTDVNPAWLQYWGLTPVIASQQGGLSVPEVTGLMDQWQRGDTDRYGDRGQDVAPSAIAGGPASMQYADWISAPAQERPAGQPPVTALDRPGYGWVGGPGGAQDAAIEAAGGYSRNYNPPKTADDYMRTLSVKEQRLADRLDAADKVLNIPPRNYKDTYGIDPSDRAMLNSAELAQARAQATLGVVGGGGYPKTVINWPTSPQITSVKKARELVAMQSLLQLSLESMLKSYVTPEQYKEYLNGNLDILLNIPGVEKLSVAQRMQMSLANPLQTLGTIVDSPLPFAAGVRTEAQIYDDLVAELGREPDTWQEQVDLQRRAGEIAYQEKRAKLIQTGYDAIEIFHGSNFIYRPPTPETLAATEPEINTGATIDNPLKELELEQASIAAERANAGVAGQADIDAWLMISGLYPTGLGFPSPAGNEIGLAPVDSYLPDTLPPIYTGTDVTRTETVYTQNLRKSLMSQFKEVVIPQAKETVAVQLAVNRAEAAGANFLALSGEEQEQLVQEALAEVDIRYRSEVALLNAYEDIASQGSEEPVDLTRLWYQLQDPEMLPVILAEFGYEPSASNPNIYTRDPFAQAQPGMSVQDTALGMFSEGTIGQYYQSPGTIFYDPSRNPFLMDPNYGRSQSGGGSQSRASNYGTASAGQFLWRISA